LWHNTDNEISALANPGPEFEGSEGSHGERGIWKQSPQWGPGANIWSAHGQRTNGEAFLKLNLHNLRELANLP